VAVWVTAPWSFQKSSLTLEIAKEKGSSQWKLKEMLLIMKKNPHLKAKKIG